MGTTMGSWRASLLIAAKDLRALFRDRTGMLLAFALPVALVLAFGFTYQFAMSGPGGLSRATLVVVDADDTEPSRAFVAALKDAETIRVDTSDEGPTADEAREQVADGEAHHVLIIEKGFAESLAAERFPALSMVRDPGRDLEDRMISIGLLQAFLASQGDALAPLFTARALELAGLPPELRARSLAVAHGFSASIEALFRDGAAGDGARPDVGALMNQLVPVTTEDVAPPDRPKRLTYLLAQAVSGIAVMMLMFGLVACGAALIREREEGTLQRLLQSAAPRGALLAGKLLFAVVAGALQLVVMFAVGGLVFRIDMLRDPTSLIVISAVVLVAVAAFGILIATWARTQKQAEGLATLVILVMSAIGGAWFPIHMVELPLAADVATRCTLTWWAMDAYQSLLWHGKPWSASNVLVDLGVLLAFAVVALGTARVLFRRSLGTA